MTLENISIFTFDNLHAYIQTVSLGYRHLEKKSSIHKATLHKIVHGNSSTLDPQKVYQFSQALGHTQHEHMYFSLLCQIQISKKEKTLSNLHLQRKWLKQQVYLADDSTFTSDFSINIIKQLACLSYSNGHVSTMYQLLNSKISEIHIRDTIQLLQEQGIISSSGPNSPFQSHNKSALPPSFEQDLEALEWASLYFSEKGGKSPRDMLYQQSFGTTLDGIQEINSHLQKFTEELEQIIEKHSFAADQIYQCNINGFPLISSPLSS